MKSTLEIAKLIVERVGEDYYFDDYGFVKEWLIDDLAELAKSGIDPQFIAEEIEGLKK